MTAISERIAGEYYKFNTAIEGIKPEAREAPEALLVLRKPAGSPSIRLFIPREGHSCGASRRIQPDFPMDRQRLLGRLLVVCWSHTLIIMS